MLLEPGECITEDGPDTILVAHSYERVEDMERDNLQLIILVVVTPAMHEQKWKY